MIHTTSPAAKMVTVALEEQGRSVLSLANETAIPNPTLRRRLVDGNFTMEQLIAITEALNLDPVAIVSTIDTSKGVA